MRFPRQIRLALVSTLCTVLALILGTPLAAQTVTGTISGIVRGSADERPSGAIALPRAVVASARRGQPDRLLAQA